VTDTKNQPTKKNTQTRSRVYTAIRVVVSVGLLGFLFYKVGLDHIFNAIRSADAVMVFVIFAVMLAEHLHGTYKWLILLRHTAGNITFGPLLRIRYLSAFLGIFGLGAVTIEVVRMYGLARYTSDLAMSFTSILMDRLLGLTGLSLMILFGVVIESRSTVAGVEYWAAGALAMILAGWVAIMNPGFRKLTDKMLSPRWLSMARDKQNKVYQSLDTYRGRPGLLAWGMVQSIFFNLMRILVVIVGAKAVGVEAPVSAYFVVVPAVIFAMLIPISMSGWGVREAMFAALLPLYGADRDTVIAMSLLIGVCGVLSTLPGAVILMTGTGIPKPNDTLPAVDEQS
jgi:glycosyltransferase 2 family protein